MSDLPALTLKGDMPIQVSSDLSLRIRRGERIVVVYSVPEAMFDTVAERQCQRNHIQTLMRIKERGGFGVVEALCVLSALGYDGLRGIPEEGAHRVLYAMVVAFNRGQRVAESAIDLPSIKAAARAEAMEEAAEVAESFVQKRDWTPTLRKDIGTAIRALARAPE